MIQNFFAPIDINVLSKIEEHDEFLGNQIVKHSLELGFPELNDVQLAFFDVREGRSAIGNEGTGIGADEVRSDLYKLYKGNWKVSIVDLGSILQGNEVKDTYYAVQEVVSFLLKKNILPMIMGGGKDLIYANYRGYNNLDQVVNLAVVSNSFNFGNIEDKVSSKSYLSKILLEQPCNLFNYANLGYQTYYNSQEEIDLIGELNFESYRVGVLKNIDFVEPILRDADIVSVDLGVLKYNEAPANENVSPNGLKSEDVCAIARYTGLSDKVTSFGVFEYNKLFDNNNQTSKLIAQMFWYFIEGYSLRVNDFPFGTKDKYLKYLVSLEDQVINFYQSDKSKRWWMQVDLSNHTKYDRHVLVSCSYQDYLSATEGNIPERWYNAQKKIS